LLSFFIFCLRHELHHATKFIKVNYRRLLTGVCLLPFDSRLSMHSHHIQWRRQLAMSISGWLRASIRCDECGQAFYSAEELASHCEKKHSGHENE
jgi:hypothetical protein